MSFSSTKDQVRRNRPSSSWRTKQRFSGVVRNLLDRAEPGTKTKHQLSHRLSQPFEIDKNYQYDESDLTRAPTVLPKRKGKAKTRAETVSWSTGRGPAHSVQSSLQPAPKHQRSCSTPKRKAEPLRTDDDRRPSTGNSGSGNKSEHSSKSDIPSDPSSSFPRSIESLYVHMGIITSYELRSYQAWEYNPLLASWASAHPIVAMQVMDLAQQLNLPLIDPNTLKLNEPYEHQLTRMLKPQEAQHHHKRSFLSRALETHLSPALNSSADAVPEDEHIDPQTALPLAVVYLYASITGLDLTMLPATSHAQVLGDWSRRWPVTDYHVYRVIEKWTPAGKMKGVDLQPRSVNSHSGQSSTIVG